MLSRTDFASKEAFLSKFGEILKKGTKEPEALEYLVFASTIPEWSQEAKGLFETFVYIENLVKPNAASQGSSPWLGVMQSTFGWAKYLLPVFKSYHLQGGAIGIVITALSAYLMKSSAPEAVGPKAPEVQKIDESLKKIEDAISRIEAAAKTRDKSGDKDKK